MGSCFSKKKLSSSSSKDPVKKNEDASESKTEKEEKSLADLNKEKKDQRFPRKEVFLIKHSFPPQLAEENANSSCGMRKSSPTKEESDAILVQCGRLSRSNSPSKALSSRRKRSGYKSSFDFDNQDDEIERCQFLRTPSREREQQRRSGSKERGVSSGGVRRLSQSPGRRSENSQSPGTSIKTANGNSGNSGSIPVKMVPVPATVSSLAKDKIKNGGYVEDCSIKRVYVKRSVSPRSRSPSRTNPKIRNHSGEIGLRKTDRRTPLSQIDSNTFHYPQSSLNRSRSARRSRDLDMNEEISHPSTSYACFLLEDIRNFHQKNKAADAAAAAPSFSLPACVSKACSIVEAIADFNSIPNSNVSIGGKIGEGKGNLIGLMESNFPNYVTVKRGGDMEEQESWGINSFGIDRDRKIPVVAATNST